MSHEMNEQGSILELAKYRLQVAKEDLETAIDNEKAGHLRAANNRAYYAIYHAITAVLALDEIAYKRHKDTISYFNKTYVREEIFPRSLGHRIAISEEVRHNSDYDEFYIVSKEETEKQIQTATELINEVEKFLDKKQEK